MNITDKDKFYSDLNYYKRFTLSLFKDKLLQFELSSINTLELVDKQIHVEIPLIFYNNKSSQYECKNIFINYIRYYKHTDRIVIYAYNTGQMVRIEELTIEVLYNIIYEIFEKRKDRFELKK